MKNLLFLLLAVLTLTSCQEEFISELEQEQEIEVIDNPILDIINDVRTVDYIINGKTFPATNALVWDLDLENISKIQTKHMDENNDWCIVWKDGTDLSKRFELADCDYKPRFEGYVKMSTTTCPPRLAIDILFETYHEILMSGKYNIVAVTQTGRYWSIVLANKPI